MAISGKDIEQILRLALTKIEDEVLCSSLQRKLVAPQKQLRFWEWGTPEKEYPIWLVAEVGQRDVGIAYAEEGFGANGYPWGIIFLGEKKTGSSNCWYSSLEECARDSGYFA